MGVGRLQGEHGLRTLVQPAEPRSIFDMNLLTQLKQHLCEVGSLNYSILQMRKLKHKK